MTESVSNQLTNTDVFPALDAVNRFSEQLANVRTESQRELVQMSDLGELILNDVALTRTRGGVTGIPTGFPSLDRATRGLQPGDIYVILARPKMGKTTLMLRIADYAHRGGFTPLVVSMEMRQEQMARRHFAMRAGIDMTLLQRGQISTFAEDMIREKITEMRSQSRYHFVEGQFKSDVQDVLAMVQSLRPHVLIVDGGYLLKMRRSQSKARWELVTDIAAELKHIASICMIPVVVSFQFNREVKKGANNADMANIQLADAIGQLASVAIGLFEPRDTESVLSQRRRLIKIIGGREGEGDVEDFEINWDFRRMNFDEIEEVPFHPEFAENMDDLVDE
jgi:replicative DNA helicase